MGLDVLCLNQQSGINRSTLRKSYYELARRHHPDRGGIPEEFRKVNKAYEKILQLLQLEEASSSQFVGMESSLVHVQVSIEDGVEEAADDDELPHYAAAETHCRQRRRLSHH